MENPIQIRKIKSMELLQKMFDIYDNSNNISYDEFRYDYEFSPSIMNKMFFEKLEKFATSKL